MTAAFKGAFVYVLGSGTPERWLTYVGWTDDIARRLSAHNTGKGARTTRGRVWVLLYAEKHPTKNAAMSREWHLKRDRVFRKQLVLNGGLELVAFSQPNRPPLRPKTL